MEYVFVLLLLLFAAALVDGALVGEAGGSRRVSVVFLLIVAAILVIGPGGCAISLLWARLFGGRNAGLGADPWIVLAYSGPPILIGLALARFAMRRLKAKP